MKTLLLFIFLTLFLFLNTVNSQNTYEKSGELSGDETWTRGTGTEGDIYRIVGDVTVPSGITLTIEAGVRVHFAGLYRILVNGTLNAQGTISDSIIFRHEDPGTNHHGIDFISTSTTSILEYCHIRDGVADGSSGSNQEDLCGGGIYIGNSSPIVRYCVVSNNFSIYGGGIFIYETSSPILESNKITNNIAVNLGGGIAVSGGGSIANPSIFNNLIYNNTSTYGYRGGGGISFYNDCRVNLYNNIIYNNSTYGNGGGLIIYNDNNIISIVNCIFWLNTSLEGNNQISNLGNNNILSVSYSDVENGYPGNYNIDADPLFIDQNNGNFSLTPESPCIDAGSSGGPSIDFDENPTGQDGNNDQIDQYDMGAFEFLQEVYTFSNENTSYDYFLDTFEDGPSNQIASITLTGTITGSGDIAVNCYTKCMPLYAPQGSKAVHRWYWMTESANLSYSGVTLTLYYSDVEFEMSKLMNENNLTIWHYENGSWVNKGGLVNTTQNSVTVYTDMLEGYWAFADVNDSSLPVQLKRFEAFLHFNGIKLEWETVSEVNNAGFEVWKKTLTEENYQCISSYRDNFSLIGTGSSNIGRTYEYLDKDIISGENYQYTLTSVNFDGSKENFQSVTISTNPLDSGIPQSFFISQNYPNPFNPITHFKVESQISADVFIEIFNNNGEKIDQISVVNVKGTKQIAWNADGLPTGIYFYRIKYFPNDFFVRRMIVKEGKMLLIK